MARFEIEYRVKNKEDRAKKQEARFCHRLRDEKD